MRSSRFFPLSPLAFRFRHNGSWNRDMTGAVFSINGLSWLSIRSWLTVANISWIRGRFIGMIKEILRDTGNSSSEWQHLVITVSADNLVPVPHEMGYFSLQWHQNGRYGISIKWGIPHYNDFRMDVRLSQQQLDSLFNYLLKLASKKASIPGLWGLCEGNLPVTGGFPSQRTSNAESVCMRDVIV